MNSDGSGHLSLFISSLECQNTMVFVFRWSQKTMMLRSTWGVNTVVFEQGGNCEGL